MLSSKLLSRVLLLALFSLWGGLPVGGGASFAWAGGPAAPSTDAWRVRAVSSTVEDAVSAAARAKGATGSAAIPACSRVATGLLLCVESRARPGEVALRAELEAAQTTTDAVFARVRTEVEGAWAGRPAGTYTVEGVPGRYFVRAAGDGYDAAALLRPELLARLAGSTPVVAVPEAGTLMWWVPGSEPFDKMVAVGVRRMAEASASPVSARVYTHDGERWTVWAVVRGSIEVAPPAGAAASGASP